MKQENKNNTNNELTKVYDYDKSLAVKCNNGTFVGKETDELIIWKGIPYATQPVGKLRWQKALPAADDDGVYDVYPSRPQITPTTTAMTAAITGLINSLPFFQNLIIIFRCAGKPFPCAFRQTKNRTKTNASHGCILPRPRDFPVRNISVP